MGNCNKNIINNYNKIKKEIGSARLVAVTKSVGNSEIEILKSLGQNVFGENRVDCEEKVKVINAEWHMIGHLQSNKVKKAVELFDWIDSVDSIKLAAKINDAVSSPINVMVQVNIGMEPQKFGIDPDDVFDFIDEIRKFPNLKLRGLMCIAPKEEPRKFFKQMKLLFDQTRLEYLSMGMTSDYRIAIEEGANMVRIGTALFETSFS